MKIKIPQMQSIQLDQSNFEKLKIEKLRPQYNLDGLRILRMQARNERDLREFYKNRVPYELLQNADDAKARNAIFILSSEGMAFVHDGKWFTTDNFYSLADGWSDKDPNTCIGHKGLGFRSVLDITPSPYIIKLDPQNYFAVKFSWALNKGHIDNTLNKTESLRSDYNKWTEHGQVCCPIMSIPGFVKKQSLGSASFISESLIRGTYGSGLTTMFWFPSTDPDIQLKVLNELGPAPILANQDGLTRLLDILKNEISVLLPFLASITKVEIYEQKSRIGSATIPEENIKKQKSGEMTVITEFNGQKHSNILFRMTSTVSIPPDIRNLPKTPKAIKEMKDVSITLSVKIENGQPVPNDEARFHVYFPTEEKTAIGFVIHADFYVTPDRKHLIPGDDYNEWLLGVAAKKAANEFLTQLLQRYNAHAVFSALSSTTYASTNAAETFISLFSKELQKRTTPFVPTQLGLLNREEVLLPPSIDKDGFWDENFSDVINQFDETKKAFLLPEVDGENTRDFMRLANVQVGESESLLTFIKLLSSKTKTAEWWYNCYTYMTNDEEIADYDYESFKDHKIIPCSDSNVIEPSDDEGIVICFLPFESGTLFDVPPCFSSVFVFLDHELAKLLSEGDDNVSSWVLNKFKIFRFEASGILPKSIRVVTQRLFEGSMQISVEELINAWTFIKKIVDSSRTIHDPSFWQHIGRFPFPIASTVSFDDVLKTKELCPAFLTYWPDSWTKDDNCLFRLEGFRRINEEYLNTLVEKSGYSDVEWTDFLNWIGVSDKPKVLRYARVVAKGQELPFELNSLDNFQENRFTGERQYDENLAVIDTLKKEDFWEEIIESFEACDHDAKQELQSLKLLEGLNLCSQRADEEFQSGDISWKQRLWSLIRGLFLPSADADGDDFVYCHGGGGHSIPVGRYLQKQLNHYRWLPTSYHGPAKLSECFLRQSTRRLISTGRGEDEIGDWLLPYITVDSFDEIARLQNLGVGVLEDASSADISILVRALGDIGNRLSTEWGQKEILDIRGRWRLVRGAVQDICRVLNQTGDTIKFPPDIKFAVRLPVTVEFKSLPLYYADPGSAIERAFLGVLPLFDADRAYRNLFKQLGVIRLVAGETVIEEFLAGKTARPIESLYDEIVNDLAPYLLALVRVKADKSNHEELVLRRLKERFEVRKSSHLIVSLTLKDNPSIKKNIEFPKFYLQRKRMKGVGAIEEFHYTLYVANSESDDTISTLDADALGEALTPVFLDGIRGDELEGFFPRVASRYQFYQGRRDKMEDFLYHHLGVSKESQDMAWDMTTGEATEQSQTISTPPPPDQIIDMGSKEKSPDYALRLKDRMKRHQEGLSNKTSNFVGSLMNGAPGSQQSPESSVNINGDTLSLVSDAITPEQKDRGERGEEEIKRRLELPGGWGGFTLIADRRADKCGYDFLCAMGDKKIKLEVKTFTRNGRIVVTNRELQVAAEDPNNYYLVGVLDEENPETEWSTTCLIPNPVGILLMNGEFDFQTTLRVKVADIWDLDRK